MRIIATFTHESLSLAERKRKNRMENSREGLSSEEKLKFFNYHNDSRGAKGENA